MERVWDVDSHFPEYKDTSKPKSGPGYSSLERNPTDCSMGLFTLLRVYFTLFRVARHLWLSMRYTFVLGSQKILETSDALTD